MLVDLTIVLSTLLAQAPLVAITILVILLYVERRFNAFEHRIDARFEKLENRINSLEHRVSKLEDRVSMLENRIGALEHRVGRLEDMFSKLKDLVGELGHRISGLRSSINALVSFNELLLSIQTSKGYLTATEYGALSRMLSQAKPFAESKYYTKETEKKLLEILSKAPDEITWEDVFEMEKIRELLYKEAEATGDNYYAKYADMLRALMALMKGFLLKRGVFPPEGSRIP